MLTVWLSVVDEEEEAGKNWRGVLSPTVDSRFAPSTHAIMDSLAVTGKHSSTSNGQARLRSGLQCVNWPREQGYVRKVQMDVEIAAPQGCRGVSARTCPPKEVMRPA